MENKLLLLVAPSATGKTTTARLLCITDRRFRQVQVITTRELRGKELGKSEKVNMKLEELEALDRNGELANFNPKYESSYGIRKTAITSILEEGVNAVLEMPLERIEHMKKQFPTFVVFILVESEEILLGRLTNDGRDTDGKRVKEVVDEYRNLIANIHLADLVVYDLNNRIMDTTNKIHHGFLSAMRKLKS